MTAIATEKPLCACHDQPMYWSKDSTRQDGGRWRCPVRQRATLATYHERHPEKNVEYATRHKVTVREEVVDAEKDRRGNACQDCGSAERLEWHHRDPAEMEFRISNHMTKARERVIVELDKCDLLCRSCHLVRHQLLREAVA